MSRRRTRLSIAVVALAVLLVGCGGDGDPVSAGAGDAPAAGASDEVCADAVVAVLDPVTAMDDGEGGRESDGTTPVEAEVEAALERLVATGPDDVARDATSLLALSEVDGETPYTPELDRQVQTGLEAADRLIDWTAERCDIGGTIAWRCLVRSSFRPVGAPVGEEHPWAASSPEDVIEPIDGRGEPVEVSRTDDVVVFAWVDGDGLAVSAQTIREVGGEWHSAGTSTCDDGDVSSAGFTTIPAPLHDEGLPPPSSSTP